MISIVIPAYQEEAYIVRTLVALRATASLEVTVVANGCTDRTAEAARAHGARVIETPRAGVSHARNLGARESVGDALLFLDADTVLGPGALDPIAAAVPARADYGTCRIRPDRPTPRATVATTLLAWGHRIAGTSLGVLFCTRALFERSGGYDERLVAGEDNDLNARFRCLGGRRIYLGEVCAFTSMRRFERLGYVRTNLAWLRGWRRPPDRYEAVR
jgi:glycosyltransferase involved in cell wall biosynthesis